MKGISEWKNSEKENKKMLELIDNAYGNVELKNRKFFNWQYNENPQGIALIVLYFDEKGDDIIVGQEPIIPTILNIDNKKVNASLSLNSIVHLEYRGKGIFSKLVSSLPELALKRGINSVHGVPNPTSHKIFLKQGWEEIAKLPLLVRPLKPSNYFKNFLKIVLKPLNSYYKINFQKNLQVEEYLKDFSEDFDILTSKLSKRKLVSQNRSYNYLQWRYKNHPTRKYFTYIVKENSEIIGYIVTRKTDFNGKSIGVILDFLIDEGKNELKFVNLVKYALADLQKKGAAVAIVTMPPSMLEYKILKKSGFFKLPEFMKPEPLPFIVNIFDKNNTELNKIKKYENWFFTFGDYDVF